MSTKIKIPKKFMHGRIKRRGISAGGGGSTLLTNLVAWYKADAITGLADNDPVATWLDSSGNNNHATQGAAADRPLYKTGIVNGLPVVRFDGVSDFLESAYSAADLPSAFQTWFAVFRTNVADAMQMIYWMGDLTANGFGIEGEIHIGISDFILAGSRVHAEIGTNPTTAASNIDSTDTANFHILCGRFTGLDTLNGVSQVFLDGQAGSLKTGATAAIGTWSGVSRIGRPGLGVRFFNGDLAELLVYDADKNSQRNIIESYLKSKYGTP